MSIQLRTIVVLNVFVAALATVMVFVSRQTAGRVVEERLASQMAVGVSAFLQSKSYPLSDTMMQYLRDIFHADWVAADTQGVSLVGSSIPPAAAKEFRTQLAAARTSGRMVIGGRLYRVVSQPIVRKDGTTTPATYWLFMLVPDAQLEAARSEAAREMFKLFLPALALATLVAFLLSFTITRPIRRLMKEMDALAVQASNSSANSSTEDQLGDSASMRVRPSIRGATEIVRLANSYRRLLDRLAAAREDLARSERLATLGKVSLGVAHELRNPLSGIKMNVRLLKDDLGEGPGRESLTVILHEIDRMDLYLQELVRLSQGFQANGASRSRTRLSELSDGVLTLLAGRCRHARISVERQYPRDEPFLEADADALRQCIMNLLINAIEAMPDGGILRVTVLPAAGTIKFLAADSGGGVQFAPGQDIFDAFVSGKPNGVGLGLYLAREAIRRHGGQIGYQSGPGGATFWFELPGIEAAREGASVLPASSRGEAVRAT